MALVGMTLWIFLLIAAISIWAIAYYLVRPNKETKRRAVALGLFLLIFDYIFENIGYQLGLWEASG